MEELEGLKGLTTKDRQNWEKQYASQIKGFNNDQIERYYRNVKFKEKFGNRSDYNIIKNYTPEQRDSLYNGELFKSQNVNSKNNQVNNISKAFNQGEHYKEEEIKLSNKFNQFPSTGKKAVEDFDKIATNVSPYYKKYKNTEYLPFSEDEKVKLAAEYSAAKTSFGEDEANNILRRKMQDTASKNQGVLEKYWNGFRGMGAQAAGALIGTAGMIKGAIDASTDDKDDNVISFLDKVIDNDWTRYGNDVMQYGSLYDADIKKAKETGISNIPVIRTKQEEQGGILDNLLSVNTVPELINQQGFTVASMLTGTGLSAISNKVFQGAKGLTMAANKAGVLGNIDKVNKVLKGLQVAQQKANAFVVPAMVGTVEGVSEGLNTKMRFLDDAKQMIAETQSKAVNDEFNRRLQNPEELSRLGYNIQDSKSLEKLYKDIYTKYAPRYAEAIQKAEEDAAKAGVYNFGLNSMINGALNMTLKAGLQTPSVQESLRRSRLGRLFTSDDFRVESGRVVPSSSKIKDILNVLQEPAGEFTEEYLQSTSDAFARGGAEYNLHNYLVNKYKGDGKSAIDDSMANDLLAASKAAGESMISKETILSGIYGALASGIGTPTINNRRGPAVRMEDESKLDYAIRRSPITYRNPILQAIQEQKENNNEKSSVANIMSDWIQDPTNKSKYDGLVGTVNWAKSMEEASGKNDEFNYRNSELGKTINDVMTLEKLKGTDYYNSLIQDLTKTANIEEGSDEANKLIEQFKNTPNNRDVEQDDNQVLSTIKKNSNKLLDTMSKISAESENIDKMLGNAADEDTKQALIYGKLSIDSWRERATQLENEINNISINNTTSSNLNNVQKKLLVNYGSLNKANSEYQKLKEKTSELQQDISNINSRVNLGTNELEILKAKRVALKTLNKQANDLANVGETLEKNPILNESEILQLDPVDRAIILNPENKSKYSEKQQVIIDNIIKEGTIKDSNFINKIQDAGRINLAQQSYLRQYNDILSNPSSFNSFVNRIKQQVSEDNTRKKYEFLNTIEDYPTFTKDLDKAYRESDITERKIIKNILKDNQNFIKYTNDNKNLEGFLNQLNSNNKFSTLDESDKDVIIASLQFLNSKGVAPTDDKALATLMEVDNDGTPSVIKYIDDINSQLPENSKISSTSLEEIIQTFNDVLKAHNKNTEDVKTINKPVEITSTKSENSESPKAVGIFGQIQQNPSLVADIDLKADDSKPKEKPTQPRFIQEINNNPSLIREVNTKDLEEPKGNIVDKYNTNSNEEVANSIQNALSIIDKSSDIYNEVKEQARQILDELGDSEYETSNDISNTIITKANQLQALVETGGDRNDRIASLLKQVASKMNVKTVVPVKEESKKPSIIEDNKRNNSLITTAAVNRYPTSSAGKAYKDFSIDSYLRKGKITPKTNIMFMVNPAITDGIKQDMGDKYNEADHLPIIAIVEDNNGPITINDKRYQPIGFMPRTSANSQGAARMESIRSLGLTQQDGTLLKDNSGKIIVTNGYTRANPPEHTKAGTPNTLIHTIMQNDMDVESRNILNNKSLPIQDRQAIYKKFKNNILSKIRRISQDSKGERIHLAYVTSNMKGGEQEFELYITTPQNSYTRSGKTMLEVLKDNNPEEILSANSRISRYTKILEKFFKSNPFSEDLKFKREDDNLIATKDSITKLNSIADGLSKKLNNFITIPKGYEYVLTPTEDMLGNNRMYQLSITNGINTVNLARVTNGTMTDNTKAQTIVNLLLDDNKENFRTEGNQPFAKWQVNYSDFESKEGESDDIKKIRLSNINDIFDDNIIESSRYSLQYNISGVDINSPFKQDYKPEIVTPVITNKDNATNTSINTPVITPVDQIKVGEGIVDSESGAVLEGNIKTVDINKTKDIINNIISDSKKIKLADDNSGYIDSNGVKYARVTSIIQADEFAGERFDPDSPWIVPSTNIGTAVDDFVRDFFAGEFFDNDGKLVNDYYYDYANASQDQWKSFAKQLIELKNSLDAKGLTIIPRDITVTGTIEVTDSNNIKHPILVAGTLDLLAYDGQGNFHIFDMKTNRSGINEEKLKKYSKQVSIYQKFIEDKYGIKVNSLNIIPINVTYPTPLGFGNGRVKYEADTSTNQLTADGKEYKNSKPILEKVGSVPFTNVNIQYDKLTNTEKKMITDMLPAGTEVKKTEIIESEKKVNKNLGLPMGKRKDFFAKPVNKSSLINPSSNNWELLNDDIKQTAITMGYTKESWNSMTEEEKKHQKECLS